VERGGEGSQVGNLCSAACGKVVARNLEIAEAERAGRGSEGGAGAAMGKETRKRAGEEERRNGREKSIGEEGETTCRSRSREKSGRKNEQP